MKKILILLAVFVVQSQLSATYLGKLSSNQYDPDSVSNPYGQYGSRYSPKSINNPYGEYGSRYSNKSINNPWATNAPIIVQDNWGSQNLYSN